MTFPVTPYVFCGIQLRGIGRKRCKNDAAVLFGNVVFHTTTTMNRQPIPNNQEFTPDLPTKMPEEVYDLRSFDRARVEPEIKSSPRDAGNGRKILPVKVKLQLRRLAAWGPCTTDMGTFRKSAFIYEDDGSVLPDGFFLTAGHVYRFQRRIASSSRSMALREGRWQLHPNSLSSFDTWPGWYSIPETFLIAAAILGSVHKPLKYPCDSGPRSKTRLIRFISCGFSLGLRPVRPAERRPRTPCFLSTRAQRDTEVSLTFNCRATSACFTPLRRSIAASLRRCSSALSALPSRLIPFGLPMPGIVARGYRYV